MCVFLFKLLKMLRKALQLLATKAKNYLYSYNTKFGYLCSTLIFIQYCFSVVEIILICCYKFLLFLGYNVAHRRRKTGKVGFSHRLTKEDAMKWFQQKVSSGMLEKCWKLRKMLSCPWIFMVLVNVAKMPRISHKDIR